MTLRELRRQLRASRRALPDAERRDADRAIRAALRSLGTWQRGRRVAVFLSMPGEVDLRPCLGEETEDARRADADADVLEDVQHALVQRVLLGR